MPKKPIAIVLGGTTPHVELINSLRFRGYYVILVDYLNNPPAREFADEHAMISTLDIDAVLDFCIKKGASVVISLCIDPAMATACFVSETLSLPQPYSYNTARNLTDKNRMKRILSDNDIPTAKYLVVQQADSHYISSRLSFPIVVKPTDNWGSRGVSIVNTTEELSRALADAQAESRNSQVIIEEFIQGTEISADCFVQGNNVWVIQVREKFFFSATNDSSSVSVGSISPARISNYLETQIRSIASKCSKAFDLMAGPMLIQFIARDEQLWVIEVAGRIGGSTHFKNIKYSTGINIIDLSLDAWLGKSLPVPTINRTECYASAIIYGKSGSFYRATGYEPLIQEGVIRDFILFKSRGDKIPVRLSTSSRVAAFIASAPNRRLLFERVGQALETLQVLDSNGADMIWHEASMLPMCFPTSDNQ